jgi:hypothetical protein
MCRETPCNSLFKGGIAMSDVHEFSERVIDLAKRLQDVADAAEGKGNRGGGGISAKWLLLPAAGAGLYALVTNNSVGRHAKHVMDQAKTRAAELPDDLMSRVSQASQPQPQPQPQPQRSRSTAGSSRKTGGAGSSRRKKSSARKSTSAR